MRLKRGRDLQAIVRNLAFVLRAVESCALFAQFVEMIRG